MSNSRIISPECQQIIKRIDSHLVVMKELREILRDDRYTEEDKKAIFMTLARNLQFNDMITNSLLSKRSPILNDKDFILELFKHNHINTYDVREYAPQVIQHRDVQIILVKLDGQLDLLDESDRDLETCKLAVAKDLRQIINVPENLLSNAAFNDAKIKVQEMISQHPDQIQYLPDKLISDEMYIAVIKKNYLALCFAPERMFYRAELADEVRLFKENLPQVIKEKWDIIYKLKKVIQFSPENYVLAMTSSGFKRANKEVLIEVLESIPSKFRTFEVLQAAIANSRYMTIDVVMNWIMNNIEYTVVDNRNNPISANNNAVGVDKDNDNDKDKEYKNLVLEYLKAGSHFVSIPKRLLDYSVYSRLVQHMDTPDWIGSIKDYKEKTSLTDDEFTAIKMACIKKSPAVTLQHLDKSQRDLPTCMLVAILGGGINRIKDYKNETVLSKEEYELVCLETLRFSDIRANQYILNTINKEIITDSFYKRTNSNIKFEWLMDFEEITSITTDEYLAISVEEISKDSTNVKIANPKYLSAALDRMGSFSEEFIKKVGFYPPFLRYLANHYDRINMPADDYKKFLLNVLTKDRTYDASFSFSLIPPQLRSLEMCEFMVSKKPELISEILNYATETLLTPDEFKSVCNTAIEKNEQDKLLPIPADMLDMDLYRAIIRNKPRLIRELIKNNIQNKLAEDEFNELLTLAINSDPTIINIVPANFITNKLLIENCQYFYGDKILDYIKQNNLQSRFTGDEYRQMCLQAVSANPLALAFVDEALKADIINVLGLNTLLTRNYGAKRFLPTYPDYTNEIKTMLSQLESVVLTVTKDVENDVEIRDGMMVYIHADKRHGKSLHVNSIDAETLFSDLGQLHRDGQIAENSLQLVILGHISSEGSQRTLAGFLPENIAKILEKNPIFSGVKLLACLTADAKKFDQELVMEQRIRDKAMAVTDYSPCGVLLMSKLPNEREYEALVDKLKDKEGKVPAQAVFMVKIASKPTDKYHLIQVARNDKGALKANIFRELSETEILQVGKLLGNKNTGRIGFPKKKDFPPLPFRGGKSAQLLNEDEFTKLDAILSGNNPSEFSKDNQKYKENKQLYPFLTSYEVQADELDKINNSLFKDLYNEIQKNPHLTRSIEIRAYANRVHVDTKEKQLKVNRTHPYTDEYHKSRHGFFNTNKDNLNRKKIETERKEIVDKILKADPTAATTQSDQQTNFKSLTIRTPKK